MHEGSDMAHRWGRKVIIQEILRREAEGLPLSLGGDQGLDQAMYQAAARIFGSWRNAIAAAGVSPQRALPNEKWSPASILSTIRQLAKRKRPLTSAQLEQRYGAMVAAARRIYGSWPKAVIAAGVDPSKLRRALPWTRERIIEAILTRALNNEPLGSRTTQPRSLVEAAQRFFGSWAAAKEVAGLAPTQKCERTVRTNGETVGSLADESPSVEDASGQQPPTSSALRGPREPWTTELVRASILSRLQQGKRLNAAAVCDDDKALYRAATRRHGNWGNALIAAGLDPAEFWRHGQPRCRSQSARDEVSFSDDDETKPIDVNR